MTFTVYNGRENTIDLALLKNGKPIDSAFVQGCTLSLYDKKLGSRLRVVDGRVGQPEADNFVLSEEEVVPGAGDDPIRIVKLKLGTLASPIPAKRNYYAELTIYTASEPSGIVWAAFPLDVLPDNRA